MAQIAPALVLIGIFVLAGFDKFASANDGAKYLAIGVAAVTGILAIISQYAAVREGEALVEDLSKIASKSAVAKKIAESRGLLSLSAIAIVGSGIAIFALVVWAVLG
jgi:low affinity Fe/Cu permease